MSLNYHDNFQIEYLGEKDEYVYDIEVEDNHNFFANDILVHNSMYVVIDDFMKTVDNKSLQKKVDAADQFCNEVIQPKIEELCEDLCDYMNGYEQKMNWSREVIASVAIWVAKKKYAMNVLDSEGVRFAEPKMKLTGLESIKSSTPEWSSRFLEKCYQYALNDEQNEMYDMIEDLEDTFDKFNVNEIAIPSGVNGIDKYYDADNLFKSGTPKHVRACLVHNMMLEKLGITNLQPISNGTKIKWVELQMPNPTGHSVIAFDTYLPKELDLVDYIDRTASLERSFKKPLKIFLESIGWETERTNTLF